MWQRKTKNKLYLKIIDFFKSPKLFFVIVLLIFISIALPLWRNLSERYGISQEIGDLQQQISRTQNKNLELQKLISYLGSDQFIEEQARENLGLKKTGEQVYIVKGLSSSADQVIKSNDSIYQVPGLEKAQQLAVVSNPQRWLNYFFNHQ